MMGLSGHVQGMCQQTLGRHPMAYGMLMAGMGLLIIILIYYVHSYKGQIAKAAVSKSGLAIPSFSGGTLAVSQQLSDQAGLTNQADDSVHRRAGYHTDSDGSVRRAGATATFFEQPDYSTCGKKWGSGASAEASALADVGQFQFDGWDGEARMYAASFPEGGNGNIVSAAKLRALEAAAQKSGAAQQKTDLLSDEALHASMQGM